MARWGQVGTEEALVLPKQVRCCLTWDRNEGGNVSLLEMMICTYDFAFQSLLLPPLSYQ